MSELDDLGDMADENAFGHGHSRFGAPRQPKKPHTARCGSPDHMKGTNIRVFRNSLNGKTRVVCKLCDKARRKAQATYGAKGYPL